MIEYNLDLKIILLRKLIIIRISNDIIKKPCISPKSNEMKNTSEDYRAKFVFDYLVG